LRDQPHGHGPPPIDGEPAIPLLPEISVPELEELTDTWLRSRRNT
jgi:hypothetical protein